MSRLPKRTAKLHFASIQSGRSATLRSLLAAAFTLPLHAQLPTARLDSVFPAGGRAGTDTEITIAGTDLDDADRLLFSGSGLTAARVEGAKFKVTASAGMAPGIYEIRAAGKYGITASRSFVVGSLPEVNEPGDNASAAKAFAVTLPVTINGNADGEAADYFKFHSAKGQSLVLTCAATQADSPLNAVLAVLDASGRELLTAHRTQQSDARLHFTSPADGDYVVKLHDIAWQAGVYRLTIASPDEAKAADAAALPLSGAVCDFASLPNTVTLDAPAASATAAHKVNLPSIIAGTSARDWVEFTGAKGRKVMLDVLSHRLGEPSDIVAQVFKVTRDDKGQEKSERVAEFDDTAAPAGAELLQLGSRDPAGSITCEDGVTYRVQLTDRFNARRPWRLALRDPQPGFSLVAFCMSPMTKGASVQRWSPFLRKGGSALLNVAVLRRDGFDAPVTIRMSDLPPEVSSGEVSVPSGIGVASLVLRAAPDAKTWNGRVQITGTSGDAVVSAGEAIPRWSAGNTGAERLDMRLSRDGLVLAVTEAEAAPLGIEPAEQKTYETAIGGSIEVPVRFLRDATLKGFKGEWEAFLTGLPGLRQAPIVKPPVDAKDAKLVLNVQNKDGNQFQPGTWTVHAAARGTIQWKLDEKAPQKELADAVWSAPITVKIEASPVLLTVPPSLTVAPGGRVELPVKLERRYGFADVVNLEFAAPDSVKGLRAEKLAVAKEATDAKLLISAAADTPHGVCEVLIKAKCTWNGQEIPWSVKLNVEVNP